MAKNLSGLFSPRAVAIVGASREETKIGHIVLKNLLDGGYQGTIYPINPSATEIAGVKVYNNYASLPETPDLAIVALPAALVLQSVTEIGEKGTKNLIIFSAGFKEMGGAGVQLEADLKALADKYDLAIVGPNCLGLVSPVAKLNATFGRVSMDPGNLRFVAQSGAIATSIFDWASAAGVGLGEFVTLGNKVNINENDFLEFWLEKTETVSTEQRAADRAAGLSGYYPVGLYLESMNNGRGFVEAAKKMSRHDPVFLLKPGKSKAAQKAMMSHTGSLAGDDAILDEALQEAGVIRCRGVEDVFDLARAFSWETAPEGNRIAVVSNAGGPAVMSADLAEQEGLTLSTFHKVTEQTLASHLPAASNIHNPVDVLGDALADRYAAALDAVLGDKNVDALLVILTPQITTQIEATAQVIVEASKRHHKPIVCAFMGGTQIVPGEAMLNKYRIPSFRYPERAIWALGRMRWWREWHKKKVAAGKPVRRFKLFSPYKQIEAILKPAQKENRPALSPLEANQLLKKIGLSVPASRAVKTRREAEFFLIQHKQIVLKVAAASLLHKSDSGGIAAGISDTKMLANAWKKLEPKIKALQKRGDSTASIQVQAMVTGGIEVIVGIKTDPSFGKVLLFGAGGVLVELVRDRNLHLLPVSAAQIQTLVESSKIFKLLNGYRGGKAYALPKLYQAIVELTSAAAAIPAIADIEINPVIITEKAAWAVDGKVLLTPSIPMTIPAQKKTSTPTV